MRRPYASKARAGWLALAVLVPFSLHLIWQMLDRAYPRNDESYYLEYAQQVDSVRRDGGWAEAIPFAYFHRHWKPILHPLSAVPFFALTGGDVLVSMKLALLGWQLIFLWYVFRLASLFLPSPRAMLCVWYIGSLPWLVQLTRVFLAELPLLAALAASVFYAWKADFFRNRRATLSLALAAALAFTIRPIEAGIFLFPLLLTLAISAWRAGAFGIADLLGAAGTLLLTIVFLALPMVRGTNHSPGAIGVGLAGLALWIMAANFVFRRLPGARLRGNFFLGTAVLSFVIAFWFAPGAVQLYDWAYTGSFGELTRLTSHRLSTGLFVFLKYISWKAGGWPLAGLLWLALALASAQIRAFFRFSTWNIAFLTAVFFPIFIGCLTYNSDFRYYVASFLVVSFALAIAVLDPRLAQRQLGFAGLFALFVFQFAMVAFSIWGGPESLRRFYAGVGADGPSFRRELDPAFYTLDGVATELEDADNFRIAILQRESSMLPDVANDPLLLTMLARERGRSWQFDRRILADIREPNRIVEALVRDYDFLLVGPIEGKPWSYSMHMDGGAVLILEKWKAGRLGDLGLRYVKTIVTPGYPKDEASSLLLRTTKEFDRSPKLLYFY